MRPRAPDRSSSQVPSDLLDDGRVGGGDIRAHDRRDDVDVTGRVEVVRTDPLGAGELGSTVGDAVPDEARTLGRQRGEPGAAGGDHVPGREQREGGAAGELAAERLVLVAGIGLLGLRWCRGPRDPLLRLLT